MLSLGFYIFFSPQMLFPGGFYILTDFQKIYFTSISLKLHERNQSVQTEFTLFCSFGFWVLILHVRLNTNVNMSYQYKEWGGGGGSSLFFYAALEVTLTSLTNSRSRILFFVRIFFIRLSHVHPASDSLYLVFVDCLRRQRHHPGDRPPEGTRPGPAQTHADLVHGRAAVPAGAGVPAVPVRGGPGENRAGPAAQPVRNSGETRPSNLPP